MKVYKNALEMIGKTPMLHLQNFDAGHCQLFLKLEQQNPGGSIKDRIALTMIEAAEKDGKLKPGGTIVEATAGNTGLGLALVAKLKGYKMLVVMPDKMGKEKIVHLRAMGAEVVTTRSDVEKGHPDYYQDLAQRLSTEIDNSYYINQFANPANPLTHEQSTGPEIWEQMEHKLDAIVYGMGSTGTFTGLGRYMKRVAPNVKMILADPEGSVLASIVNTGKASKPGKWLVEGIGEDFVPQICDLSLVAEAYTVTDAQSFHAARELLLKEGILAGSSTGTHLHAALEYCRKQKTPQRVVTVACDTGNKYLSKMFDNEWMWNQNFIKREEFDDLRDLIARPYHQHATTTIGPNEPLSTAHKHMVTYGISQLPVMEGKKLIGMICDADLLQSIYDEGDFAKPVKEIMMLEFGSVPFTTPIAIVLTLFNKYTALAVMRDTEFLGLITPIDMINYLKRTPKK